MINKHLKKILKEQKKCEDRIIQIIKEVEIIRNECTHKYEDGRTALVMKSCDPYSEYYVCNICGKEE